jgi:diketogulonate reductase-like aldo/keto reductase
MGNLMFWVPAKKHSVQPQEFRISVFLSSVDKNTPVLLDDPVLCDMAKKHKKTPALIALRYQLQRGIVVLAKSFTEHRIKENMQVMRSLSVRLLCL